MALGGVPIYPAASYRVSVNNFLAEGGDALTAYLQGHPDIAPPATDRITKVA
jgi:5'-nucleotidase